MRHNSSGRRSRQQPAASSQQPTGFKKCAGKHHINYTEHEWPTSRVFLSYSQIFFFPKKVCYSFTQFDQNMKTWSEICIFPKQNWSCLSCSLLLLQVTFSSSQSTAKMIDHLMHFTVRFGPIHTIYFSFALLFLSNNNAPKMVFSKICNFSWGDVYNK